MKINNDRSDKGWATGWGKTKPDAEQFPPLLREVNVPIKTKEKCVDDFLEWFDGEDPDEEEYDEEEEFEGEELHLFRLSSSYRIKESSICKRRGPFFI